MRKLTCTYCRKTNLRIQFDNKKVPHNILATIDHIIPISLGGGVFDKDNVCVCCSKCNSKKGNMSIEEFLNIIRPNLVVSK
jgi:5-methylcytosine-specific restriction endonuclease McrA